MTRVHAEGLFCRGSSRQRLTASIRVVETLSCSTLVVQTDIH